MSEVMETLEANTVYSLVESKSTKIASVTFFKKDGSIRKATGLFRPSSHIIGSEQGFRQSEQMKSRGQIPFYDLQKKAWVSFYVDKVITIK